METQAQEVCLSSTELPAFIHSFGHIAFGHIHSFAHSSLSIRALVIEFVSCTITTFLLEQMKEANLEISLLEMTSLAFE